MDSMTKLRYGTTAIFILLTAALVGGYLVIHIEEKNTIDTFKRLNLNEQETIVKWGNMLMDTSGIYTILGLLTLAAEIGLLIMVWKVWHVKEIPASK